MTRLVSAKNPKNRTERITSSSFINSEMKYKRLAAVIEYIKITNMHICKLSDRLHCCWTGRPAVRSGLAGVCRIAHAHVSGHFSPTGQLVIGVAGCAHKQHLCSLHKAVLRQLPPRMNNVVSSFFYTSKCFIVISLVNTENRANAKRNGSAVAVRIAVYVDRGEIGSGDNVS